MRLIGGHSMQVDFAFRNQLSAFHTAKGFLVHLHRLSRHAI